MNGERLRPSSSAARWLRSAARGPLAAGNWSGRASGFLIVLLLTLLTQVGGLLVWPALGLASRWERRRWAMGLVFAVAFYLLGSFVVVPPLARLAGRSPLPVLEQSGLAPRTVWFGLLNRHYVQTPIRAQLLNISLQLEQERPGSTLRYLDASFPFRTPLPLLPHLSHGDGKNVDLALPLLDPDTRDPLDGGGSPIGYWAYVSDPPVRTERPDPRGRRWDLDWLQPLWGPVVLDRERMVRILETVADSPAVKRMLLEQRLIDALPLDAQTRAKVTDQGANAARHDDHLHLRFR